VVHKHRQGARGQRSIGQGTGERLDRRREIGLPGGLLAPVDPNQQVQTL
jgi:hypothetical protein